MDIYNLLTSHTPNKVDLYNKLFFHISKIHTYIDLKWLLNHENKDKNKGNILFVYKE